MGSLNKNGIYTLKLCSAYIVFLVNYICIGYSQETLNGNFNILESEVFKDKFEDVNFKSILPNEQGGAIVLKELKMLLKNNMHNSYRSILVEHYNGALEQIGFTTFNFPYNSKIIEAAVIENQIYILEISKIKKEIIFTLRVSSLENLFFNKRELLKISDKDYPGFFEEIDNYNTLFYNKKFFFTHKEKIILLLKSDKGKKQKHTVFVFNKMQLEYQKDILTDPDNVENRIYLFQDILIEDDGNIFTVHKKYFDNLKESKNDSVNYEFVLTKINKELHHHINLKTDSKYLANLMLTKSNNTLYALGTFSDKDPYSVNNKLLGIQMKRKESETKGTVLYTFNVKSEPIIENTAFSNFPDSYFKEKYDDKISKYEIHPMYIKSLHINNNETITIVGFEKYLVPTSTGTAGRVNLVPASGNILISNASLQGKQLWAKHIEMFHSGYKYPVITSTRKNHTLLFLSTHKNSFENEGSIMVQKEPLAFSSGKNAKLFSFIINARGQIYVKNLFENESDKVLFNSVNSCMDYLGNTVFMYGSDNSKNNQIVKIEVQ